MMRPYSVMTVLFPIVAVATANGCGVKGKPLPPEEPVYIGRGQDASQSAPPVSTVPVVAPSIPAQVEHVPPAKSPQQPKKKTAKSKIKQ